MEERQDAYASYTEAVSRKPDAAPRPRNAPPFHYSENADLKTAAARMFADLDRQHPLASFLSL